VKTKKTLKMFTLLKQWMWQRRQVLIVTGLLILILYAMYGWWTLLPLWSVLFALVVVVGSFWIHKVADIPFVWSTLENIVVSASFALSLVFQVQNVSGLNLLVLLFAFVMYWLLRSEQDFREEDIWMLKDLPRLQLVGLITFFLITAAALRLTGFYLAGPWASFLVGGLGGTILIGMNLARLRLGKEKLALYLGVFVLVTQEAMWLLASWGAGTMFKAFLLTSFYFIFFELVSHFERGSLTLKVVTQYLAATMVVVGLLFVVNYFIDLI
jgi:hypothetical protein